MRSHQAADRRSPASPPRSQALRALACAVAAFAAGWALAFVFLPHQYPDFGVFWTAGRHAFDPRLYDGPYLTAAQSWWPGMTPHPFVYPPTFLLLAWPFGQLPFALADYLWGGLSAAALAIAARQVVRPAWAALLLPLCVPVIIAAAYGQSIFFAAAALVGGAALIERRPALGGALIAFAMCVKPQVTILAPILLLRAPWRAWIGAAAAGAGLVLASFVFGAAHWLQWAAALPEFTRLIDRMGLKLVNLMAPGLPAPGKLVVAAAGIAFAAWSARQDLPQRIAGVACGSLCCVTYAVGSDLAVLAPTALAWVLGGWTPTAWLRRLAGLGVVLGMAASPLSLALFMLASLVAGLAGSGRLTGAQLPAAFARRRQVRAPLPNATSP